MTNIIQSRHKMFNCLTIALVIVATVSAAKPVTKIDLNLSLALTKNGKANVLVSMNEDTGSVLNKLNNMAFTSRSELVTMVANSLKEFAAASQKSVLNLLAQQKTSSFESFWITNQVYVRHADAELVQNLAALDVVSDISEEFEVRLAEHINLADSTIMAEWGIEKIQAPEAWALAGGTDGTGARVATIDTGVRGTHVDLASNYLGSHGWYDVINRSSAPTDDNGHGTHTMGTLAGQNGIGVAPGSKWLSCKALSAAGSGTNAGLIACGQFIACPTLADGTNPDCTKAPHVVSNSWGGGSMAFFDAVLNAWHAAGIVPVFANGGSGPSCGTASGEANVITVGSITSTNALSPFSAKGPSAGGLIKPDLCAPGSSVRSAWNTADNAYNTLSGGSMSCPHVAGVVGLVKSINPNLSYAQVKTVLFNGATHDVVTTGQNCGGIPETTFPNNAFGWGIVNALNSVQAVITGA